MRSARQHIVNELITTERIYVQHLELLQVLKKLSESSGAIDADSSRQIFHNLDPLLDLQRRFLRQVEQVNAQPKDEQNWGQVFITFNDLFVIYEQYIANQKLCEGTVVREFDKLKEAASPLELPHLVESPVTLCASLMRPCGRLAKYPLLLEVSSLSCVLSYVSCAYTGCLLSNCIVKAIMMKSAKRTCSKVKNVS